MLNLMQIRCNVLPFQFSLSILYQAKAQYHRSTHMLDMLSCLNLLLQFESFSSFQQQKLALVRLRMISQRIRIITIAFFTGKS